MEANGLQSSLLDNKEEIKLQRVEHCSYRSLIKESWVESKKLWFIAGPAIVTTVCLYSLGVVTQAFAGHLGTIELAAVAINDSVIAGLAFGTMMGMSSALETLCGQAFGTGDFHMLGVYMQRSWIVSTATAMLLSPLYIFAGPILKVFRFSDEMCQVAEKFSLWMIPQLFAFAIYFPLEKFLQAQSKIMVMAWIAAIGLVFHFFATWLCVVKLQWGLAGAAVTLNSSWWLITLCQLVYVVGGACPGAWRGLSWLAFRDIWAFVRLSLASAVMLCVESWYFMALIVLTGNLKNPAVAVDSISICMNVLGWQTMIPMGFNAAVSVRVSNELGAGRPKAAKFSVLVVSVTSLLIGILFMGLIFITKHDFPIIFTQSREVMEAASNLATLLALTILLYTLQPVLSGVAVGSGWQALVAYVNIGCYYVVGLPLGFLLGYKLHFGAKGIWSGMLVGVLLQTLILIYATYRTDWNKEAFEADKRIRVWGGSENTIIEHGAAKRKGEGQQILLLFDDAV